MGSESSEGPVSAEGPVSPVSPVGHRALLLFKAVRRMALRLWLIEMIGGRAIAGKSIFLLYGK